VISQAAVSAVTTPAELAVDAPTVVAAIASAIAAGVLGNMDVVKIDPSIMMFGWMFK
jgi:hypothetical protein